MKIAEALKQNDIRVTNGYKWLVFLNDQWHVLERKLGRHKINVLVVTEDEEEAVAVLLKDE